MSSEAPNPQPHVFEFINSPPIPDYLIKDVRARLAYIDEAVEHASIVDDGECIRLVLRAVPIEN